MQARRHGHRQRVHTGTGGSVVAGGLGAAPSPSLALDSGDFSRLCDHPTPANARVFLHQPVNYNGFLTFGGSVECRGANVRIASRHSCRGAVGVAHRIPARWTEWDLAMRFTVSRPGHATVHGQRVGRYVTTWVGHVTTLYPSPEDSCLDDPLAC